MKAHRNTQDTVPKNPQLDNFQLTDALESLQAAVLRVDTIAQIASDAVDELRCPSAPAAKRAFARMQILVGRAAEESRAALAQGDRLMSVLGRHVAGERER